MIITVDGLAASGKGTLARALGRHFELPVLDTGSLWRILAFQLWSDGFVSDGDPTLLQEAATRRVRAGLDLSLQDSPCVRTEKIGQFASVISCFSHLRKLVDGIQIDWLTDNRGGVLDGRETGISIAPHADFKFFLLADPVARASRRSYQIGEPEKLDEIHTSIVERDRREMLRPVAPIRPATDALVIDTTHLSEKRVIETAVARVRAGLTWELMLMKAARL